MSGGAVRRTLPDASSRLAGVPISLNGGIKIVSRIEPPAFLSDKEAASYWRSAAA